MYRKVNAFGFIGAICVFSILSHLDWKNASIDAEFSWINGQQFQAIETQFDDAFLARQFAINAWAAINFILFNQGNAGVVIGDNDWLFSSEELDNTPASAKEVTQRLATIDRARKQIEKNGSELVVTVIPSKARVYAEKLPFPIPEHADARYDFLTNWLKQEDIQTYSLLPILLPKNEEATFIKNDTHWSPLGARRSAQFIADELQRQYPDFAWHSNNFKTEAGDSKPYDGDLLNYLPLEPYFAAMTPTKPYLQQFRTNSLDEIGLFDEIDYPIALVGTSYSAKPEWNFVGALQQHTGVNVLDMSQEGKGPFLPMLEFLESNEFQQQTPKIVIWEVPERYLVITPNAVKENSV